MKRALIVIGLLSGIGACNRLDEEARSFSSAPVYVAPPPTRECTDTERSLIASSMAKKISGDDSCIWMKKSSSASIGACTYENASGLVTATGSVTIYDGLTSDTFRIDSSGIFSASGSPLEVAKIGTSYSYDEACKRAGVATGVLVVSCLADQNCRDSN